MKGGSSTYFPLATERGGCVPTDGTEIQLEMNIKAVISFLFFLAGIAQKQLLSHFLSSYSH